MLGLQIGLCEAHGGMFSIESDAHVGCTLVSSGMGCIQNDTCDMLDILPFWTIFQTDNNCQ